MKLNVFVKPNEQSGASLSQGDRPLVSREGLGRKNGSRADFRFLVLSLKQIREPSRDLFNARRFPNDFMFQLTEQEWSLISSQFVMTSRMKRPKKSLPVIQAYHVWSADFQT